MRGMGRLWQAAGTVNAVLAPGSAREGRRRRAAQPVRRLRNAEPGESARAAEVSELRRDYRRAIRRLHDLGVMINGSFVFGMDARRRVGVRAHGGVGDRAGHRDGDVSHPDAVSRERRCTARLTAQRRIATTIGICYDTRHAVFQPARMSAEQLERGYCRAYRDFYRWGSIVRGASAHDSVLSQLRHFGVCGRLEEIRAAVGLRHSREARRHDAAGARNDPQRVRAAGAEERESWYNPCFRS